MVFSQNGTPMAIRFVVKETLISSIYTKTVSSIIPEIFDKIYSELPRVVFTPLTSTNADKKKRVKYFFENYIYVKFHQNL